jgi:predicted MFS family arabinose efflux permease
LTPKLWWMVVFGVLIVLIGGGLRQSFGVFLLPVSLDLNIGREVFGFVIAIQALAYGLAQPMVGLLADKVGAFRVIVAGALLYALGLWMTSTAFSSVELLISLGLIVGLGLSGATQVVVLGAVGKVVPDNRRSLVFGCVIAASSVGMFFIVPGAQSLLSVLGWRDTFVMFAAIVVAIPLLALGLRGEHSDGKPKSTQSLRHALLEARTHRGYLLLTLGFFVCGFHVTFIGTHLPAFFADKGVSDTAAAYALGLIGLFNVAGAYVFGVLGDRYSKKNLLTGIYAGRAALMALVLIVPISDITALAFGCAMGFLWLATVPLTSSIVAQIFGTRFFSMLFGVVMMGHQLGSFCGAWLGGYIYDRTGSYDAMWMAAVALGVVAALLHWPIREAPLARLATQAA